MFYDELLAERIARVHGRRKGVVSKKMFGGVAFLLNGNMCVGTWKDSLVARIGADNYEDALEQEYVSEFAPAGKTMRGWVLISPEALDDDDELQAWVRIAHRFVKTLPAK